ncbi:MAG: lytic transglycosylase domain-containing protein [Gammaproteobacteria bacterium]|nr:lytic transglycosylase domain-containing protein [Gammaproteobacteria bacterium]
MARNLCAGAAAALLAVSATVGAAVQERPDAADRVLLSQAITTAESFDDRFDAEVWLTDMANRLRRWDEIPAEERILILKTVHQEATHAGLAPELVLSVIHVESNFDRFAISSAGARGLMQVMPFWLDELNRPEDDLFDIRTNIRFGCTILRHYLDREKGNHSRALARYNGSVGKTWYPMRVFEAMRKRWYLQ